MTEKLKAAPKKLKDPGSAITHFIGMLMAIFAATPLLIKATGSLTASTCSLWQSS